MSNYKLEIVQLKGGNTAFVGIQTSAENSLTRNQILEFQTILTECNANESVRGIIIYSDNEKFFCNGVDAQNIASTPNERLSEEMGEIVKFFVFLSHIYKPMIAEISGYAMGGGAVLSLACDYRMMLSGKSRISFTEVFFGLPLPGVFVEKLKMVTHPPYVNDMIYGTAYKAEEAQQIGLVHEIAENKEDLRKLTIKKMESLYRFPLAAFMKTKESLHYNLLKNETYHMEELDKNFSQPVIRTNLMEAMKAFGEKRKPNFI